MQILDFSDFMQKKVIDKVRHLTVLQLKCNKIKCKV